MKLAIVTACPNGMVTSVLCARLLDAAAQRQAGAPASKCTMKRTRNANSRRPPLRRRVGAGGQHRACGYVAFCRQAGVPQQPVPGPAGCRCSAASRCRRGPGPCRHRGQCRAGARNRQTRPAAGSDHCLPDWRGSHLHGRRGPAANRQAPGLRPASGNPGSVGARNR